MFTRCRHWWNHHGAHMVVTFPLALRHHDSLDLIFSFREIVIISVHWWKQKPSPIILVSKRCKYKDQPHLWRNSWEAPPPHETTATASIHCDTQPFVSLPHSYTLVNMTLIDTRKATPSLWVRWSLEVSVALVVVHLNWPFVQVPTSKLSIWPNQDYDVGSLKSSATVHSHSDTSGTSRSPNSLSSSSNHRTSTTSLELQNKAQKDDDVYFPKVRQGRSNVFLVHRKRPRFEAPGSPPRCSSDSKSLTTSLRRQDHGKKAPQAQLSSLHRSEVFVRCDTSVSPDHLPHATPNIQRYCF